MGSPRKLLGLLALLPALGGCAALSQPSSPEAVVDAYFAAVKDLDFERARQYVAEDARVGDLPSPWPQDVPVEPQVVWIEWEAGEALARLGEAQFARLEIALDGSTITGDAATVNYHITQRVPHPSEEDMADLTRALAAADPARYPEVIVDWYIDLLDAAEAVTRSYDGVARLIRVDGKWRIESTSVSLNDVLRNPDGG